MISIPALMPDATQAFEASLKRMELRIEQMEENKIDESEMRRACLSCSQDRGRKRIEIFKRVCESLPDIFRLSAVEASFVSDPLWMDRVRRRASSMKPSLYNEAVQKRHRPALSRMCDLKKAFILVRLGHGIQPTSRNGVPYDMTIDHIKPVCFGGDSKRDNLRFVPSYINQFLAWFINIQMPQNSEPVLMLEFTNAEDPFIPYVPGGFRPQPESGTTRSKIQRQHLRQLLGWDPGL